MYYSCKLQVLYKKLQHIMDYNFVHTDTVPSLCRLFHIKHVHFKFVLKYKLCLFFVLLNHLSVYNIGQV